MDVRRLTKSGLGGVWREGKGGWVFASARSLEERGREGTERGGYSKGTPLIETAGRWLEWEAQGRGKQGGGRMKLLEE